RLLDDLGFDWPERIADTEHDTRDRRALLELIASETASAPEAARLAYSPVSTHLGLARPEDLEWMLERERTASETTVVVWHQLIRSILNPEDPEHRRLASACAATRAGQLLAPLLNSAPAPPRPRDHTPVTPRPAPGDGACDGGKPTTCQRAVVALVDLLEAAHAGDPSAFMRLCLRLQSDSDDEAPMVAWGLEGDDITALPAFAALVGHDPSNAERFTGAAATYLRQHHPHTDEWLDHAARRHLAAECGYLAFAHLERSHPDQLDILPAQCWATWASALVAHSCAGTSPGAQAVKVSLLRKLAGKAPGAAPDAALRMLRAAATAGRPAHEIRFASEYWTGEFADALAGQLQQLGERAESGNYENALGLLLRHQHQATFEGISTLIKTGTADGAPQARWRAAGVVLRAQPQAGWPTIHHAMQDDPAWGLTLAGALARSDDSTAVLEGLADSQLAQLYRWCLKHVPP